MSRVGRLALGLSMGRPMHLTAGVHRRLTQGSAMPNTHQLLCRCAAAAVLSLLLPLAAAPAEADDLSVIDGSADMWRLTGKQEFAPAPTVTTADIVRTRFSHRDRRVVIGPPSARGCACPDRTRV